MARYVRGVLVEADDDAHLSFADRQALQRAPAPTEALTVAQGDLILAKLDELNAGIAALCQLIIDRKES